MNTRDSAGERQAFAAQVLDDLPAEADSAIAIVETILRVVPASHWAFARLDANAEPGLVLSGARKDGGERSRLRIEFGLQRSRVKIGPRIAATLGPLGAYDAGVTLVFADARASFGILTLLRSAELGPFTSSEISMLTLALDPTSQRLSASRRTRVANDFPAATRVDRRSQGASYVLDRDMRIVLTWPPEASAPNGLRAGLADRLPAVVEEAVRELTSGWEEDPATRNAGIAYPAPFLVVRTQPLAGPAGLFVGVRIERFQLNSLSDAAARFRISPREMDVFELLLDGKKLNEIGLALHITSSTVQDHIKSMVEKSGTKNRTELIVRMLGWESTR